MSMSTFPFLVILLASSSCLCFIMNSWLLIWVMLELNTMSFCSLLKTFAKMKKGNSEAAMKYFIIQSTASILLLFNSLSMKTLPVWVNLLILMTCISLMVKTGASPCHQWFINMVKKVSTGPSTLLMTWQKMAPVFLMSYQTKKTIFPFIILSGAVGSLSQINKEISMEILAFSSLFNLSWMMTSVLLNTTLFLAFCAVYWISVIAGVLFFNKMKMEKASGGATPPSWSLFLILISLAGVPPTMGFLSKWLVFKEVLKHGAVFLTLFLLTISSMNMYIYLRMSTSHLTKPFTSENTKKFPQNKTFLVGIALLNMTLLTMTAL